jgi:hypothetical protein
VNGKEEGVVVCFEIRMQVARIHGIMYGILTGELTNSKGVSNGGGVVEV